MGSARITALVLIAVAVGALALRLPFLDRRPMHGDEANQAVKTGQLLETGVYRYDPHDHHGPTLYYLALIPAALRGETTLGDLSETTLRLVPVAFGAGLILLLWPLGASVGYGAILGAGVLTAVSPAFVYYSRYYIQETLLVFFTLGLLVCLTRHGQRGARGWLLAGGAFAGLMHATKETAVLAFAAVACAGVVTAYWETGRETRWEVLKKGLRPGVVIGAAAVAVIVSVTLFSSFFTYGRGPLDSVLAYFNFLERAGGAGMHDKPWHAYMQTLLFVQRGPGPWWSEGFVVGLGVIGIGFAIAGKGMEEVHRPFVRFIAVYTVLLTVFYSSIPYKTPWTMLSFYHGLVIMAGVGIVALWRAAGRRIPARVALALVCAAGIGHLGAQAFRANYTLHADPRNPYVYAHTSTAHLQLVETLEGLAGVSPDGYGLRIDVIQPDRDYWPLPWYLRRFAAVGYWDDIPPRLDGEVMIVSPQVYVALAEGLEGEYMMITGGLRPSVLRAVLIRQALWDAYIETRR